MFQAPRRFKFPFYNHKLLEMNFFNWTMNYRHDSDIVESYGFRIRNRNVPLSKKDYTLRKLPNGLNVNWNMKKGNPIFWVASHCPTDNFREDYVQELKKHIGIILYMHALMFSVTT